MPTEDLIAFGVLNEDGTPKADNIFKTFETGTATLVALHPFSIPRVRARSLTLDTFPSNSQVIAAFDPSIASQNGAYLDDGVVHNEKAPAYGLTEENADKLWELSEKMWGIKF